MGVDLSAELKEAREISTEFLGVFALQYSKMYLVALMKNAKKTLAKEAAGPQWVLLKCDKCPPPQIQKTGVVKKLSKYLKKWNSRFMVVKGDYLIEYYETEEKYIAKGKPLGVINMSNKNLHRDANDTVLNRLIALAEKCQINIEEMPKPDKYPDFTLEIYHERKGPIYLECPNEEEWHAWCDIIDKCRWHAPRYNLYEDKAHVFAFPKALWRTRWECSMWGWFYGGGGEEAQLVDAINDKIADVVLSKLERKLTMPWSVRNKIRNKFIGTVDGFVTTAVGPLWKGAYAGVKELRPKVEPKIKEGMQPIVDAQKTIQDEICKMVEASSKDFIDKSVLPHLAPLLDVVFAPVVDAFKLIIRAFDVAVEKGKEKYESKEDRLFMVWHYNYNSEYWDAERKIWDLYEPLWALRLVFEDIYPWTITGRARRRLRKTLDNALYTFENILEDGKASGKSWDEAANEARGQLARDCCTAIMRVLGHILFGVVENFFEKLVIRPARKLIKPLAEKVPQAIKDFVDPEDLLEELLYNILRRTCATVFSPYATRIDLGVEASPAADATVVTRSAAVDVAQPAATQPAAEPAAEPAAQPAAVERTDVDKSNADAAAEDAARIAAEQEAAHLAAQQAAAAEEAARIAASEAAAAAEAAQREAERAAAEEAATRQAAEKAAAEEEAARREAEAKAAEEEDARRNAERAAAEEEAARQALERAAAEEEAAREAGAQEEAARQAAEKAAADEAAARLEAERAAAEEAAAREEAARAAAEEEATRAAAERAAAEEAAALQAAQQTAAEEAAARLVAEEAAAAQQAALALEQAVEAGERALEAEAAATEKVAPTHVDMEQEREETDEGIELVYFQGKGRAHATRLVLAIGGVPFKDTRLSGEEYGALLAAGALPLETLPVMKVEGQIVSSQSQAMLRFAAELADLQLSLPEDILLGEDVLGTAEDMANVLYSPWYAAATQEDKDRIAGEIAASGFAFYAKHIEERLNDRTHNEPFIAQTVSFVDAFVYCVVSYLGAAMASTVVEHPVRAFPKLSALVDAVGAIPAVAQLE